MRLRILEEDEIAFAGSEQCQDQGKHIGHTEADVLWTVEPKLLVSANPECEKIGVWDSARLKNGSGKELREPRLGLATERWGRVGGVAEGRKDGQIDAVAELEVAEGTLGARSGGRVEFGMVERIRLGGSQAVRWNELETGERTEEVVDATVVG
jgi:hypothetical protein